MPELAILILVAISVLLVKHAAADFFLQTPYQYLNKGIYGHPGGLLHSAIHVALTPLVYFVFAPGSLLVAGLIAIGEFIVHYHVDWAKEQVVRRNRLTPDCQGFWYALGTDQLIHGLSYIVIVAVLIWVAVS